MRPVIPALLLVTFLASGCGDDEPDTADTAPRPVPRQPAVDTTLGDTTGLAAGGAADAGAGEQDGEPGQPAGQGQAGGQEGQPARAAAGRAEAEAGGAGRGRLYTVQVAAFENARSATEWVERLRSQGLPVWNSLAEVRGQTFHRVRVGAVPTVAEARGLGAMITNRYEWPVWIAPLTPADRIPDSAVEDTRRLIGGS